MRKVRSSGNGQERRVALALARRGVRGFRINAREIPGTPDLAFHAERVAIFLDGCFWHGCPMHYVAPRTNVGRWRSKVAGNRRRDVRVDRALLERGWTVVRAWECSLADGGLARFADSVARTLALTVGRD